MKKFLISIFLCGVIGTNLSGCGFIDGFKEGYDKGFTASAKKNDNSDANKPVEASTKQIEDSDGKFQISVPKNWSELETIKKSEPRYCIAVGNKLDETYAGILNEPKENFSNEMTLDKFTDLCIKSTKKIMNNAEVSDIKDAEINGYKAKTFEMRGSVNDINVVRIYAIVELPDCFVHVNTWTLPSKYDKNKDVLKSVISSFKELK